MKVAVQDAQLSITYSASPIVSEYHHEQFGHMRFTGGPRAGGRAPDVGPLHAKGSADGSAVRLYDLLRGVHHTLMLFGGPAPKAENWQYLNGIVQTLHKHQAETMKMYIIVDGASAPNELVGDHSVLLDTEGAAHHRYQADLPTLYLIRPDGYIGFRSRPADQTALTAYLTKIFK